MAYRDEKDKKNQSELDGDLFGLGGLFKGIEKIIDLAGKLESSGSINREGVLNLDHIKKDLKGVYGFTIKSAGGGGSPKVETFGNIKKTAEGPTVNEEREPITDLYDENDEFVIIAEMPGIEKDDILIDLKEDIIEISTKSKNKCYRKELLLPGKVSIDNMDYKYINGILEIRIKK